MGHSGRGPVGSSDSPIGFFEPLRMVKDDKIAAAYHLAVGSHGTASDLIDITSNLVMEDELKNLAANFLRISELLVEAGFRQ